MLLRIVRCIYPNPVSAGCGLYRHQAWDHFFIIDTRAVQSLKAVIEKWSPASFIMYNRQPMGIGGHDKTWRYDKMNVYEKLTCIITNELTTNKSNLYGKIFSYWYNN